MGSGTVIPEDGTMGLRQEIDLLRRENADLMQRLESAQLLADEDPLVPLLNRRAFVRELKKTIAYFSRYGGQGAMVYFDVNNFKAVNDTHGHAAGDAVLSHLADLVRKNIRLSDFAGRLGGDEFGVVLVQADENSAAVKAGSLGTLLATTPCSWKDKVIRAEIAKGFCVFDGTANAAAIMDTADREMYAAKP